MSRKDLIKLVEQSPGICDADVDKIYELNRYGLRPGFSLCRFSSNCKGKTKDELEKEVKKQLEQQTYVEGEQYKNLKIKSVKLIAKETIEIAFSFLAKHTYLSEEEKPEFVYEFKETFAWINHKDGYIAIKNAPNKIVSKIKSIISSIYNTRIVTVCLTQKMILKIFGGNNLKKGTYYKPNAGAEEPQKVTIADANLSDKPYVRQAFSGYDMTASTLIENVNDDISSTLGINCKQGKIYLSKNLNASDFRAWSVKRIRDIITYMENEDLEATELFKTKNPLDDNIWKDYNSSQKK